jgi:hypothetical protein
MESSSSPTSPTGVNLMDLNFLGMPRPDPNQKGMGPTVLIVTWLFVSLCVVFVALRFYIRNRFHLSFKSEDWLMLFALVLHIVCQGLLTESVSWGFGKEYANMRLHEYVQVHKYEFMFGPFSYILQIVARVSIAILLIRIFAVGRVWFKWFTIGYMALMTAVCIATLGVFFAQTRPLKAWWDITIEASFRLSPYIQAYVSLALQFLVLLSDILFVFLPVMFVWKLAMDPRRRVGLALLMSASLVTAGVQSAKIAIALQGTLGKILFEEAGRIGAIFYIVSIVEQSMVIMMGCVPALGPITQIEIPFFSSLGSSVSDIFASVVRRSKNRSQASISKDLEMGRKQSLPDDAPSLGEKGSKQSLGSRQGILRVDNVSVVDHRVSNETIS